MRVIIEVSDEFDKFDRERALKAGLEEACSLLERGVSAAEKAVSDPDRNRELAYVRVENLGDERRR